MSTERWHAVGRWVVEDCAEQPEEPMPLFQCDLPANAVTVANIYNEVCSERDAAVADNARLLARIAAVEAWAMKNEIAAPPLDWAGLGAILHPLASPTPTAAEKYAPCRDCGHDSADHRNDEPRPCKKRCRCVSFESPLPGQEKP